MCGIEVCDLYRKARDNPSLSEYGFIPHDISEDGSLFVVEENHKISESGFHHCYYPYVEGYPAVFTEYNTFEDAVLASLALKLNGYRSCLDDGRVYFAKQILSSRRYNNV